MARKDKAQAGLDQEDGTPASPLALAYARERLKAAQWDLERLYRRRFGEHDPGQASQAPTLTINIIKGDTDQGITIEQVKDGQS